MVYKQIGNKLQYYIIVGVDSFLSKYPLHNKMLQKVGDKCRTMNANGSCALPLGLVAAGRADALIQPPVSPWGLGSCEVVS